MITKFTAYPSPINENCVIMSEFARAVHQVTVRGVRREMIFAVIGTAVYGVRWLPGLTITYGSPLHYFVQFVQTYILHNPMVFIQ